MRVCKKCFTTQENAKRTNEDSAKHAEDEKIVNELEKTMEGDNNDIDDDDDDDPDINFEVRPEKLPVSTRNSTANESNDNASSQGMDTTESSS